MPQGFFGQDNFGVQPQASQAPQSPQAPQGVSPRRAAFAAQVARQQNAAGAVPAPNAMMGAPRGDDFRARVATAELGATGLKRFGGDIREEFLRELIDQRGIKTYKEMAENDPVIGAVLFAIEILIRNVDWHVNPFSTDPSDIEQADFLESCMDDMSQSWTDTITEVLSFMKFGWAYHEIVYKIRKGKQGDGRFNSRHNDGRFGWRKMPLRAQETLWKWKFDDNGGLRGMEQQPPPDYRLRYVPIEKALLFRSTPHKNNPQGRSMLRSAYRPWFLKKHLENIEAIGAERDLAGLPVVWVPESMLDASATDEEKAALNEYKKIVTNLRRDEQEGIVMPLHYDENGNKTYDLTLLSTGGTRQFDTNSIINRYDSRIAMTLLADFIIMGHEKVGSFALMDSKTDIFALSIGGWLKSITEVFNRYAIPRLWELNRMPTDRLPVLEHGDVETVDLAKLGAYITALSGAGMPLFPNKRLEGFLKRQASLPVEEDDDGSMSEDAMRAEQEMLQKVQNQGRVKSSADPGKDGEPHFHMGIVDENGNGLTTSTSAGNSHTHRIMNGMIQPAADGHSHGLQG